MLTKDIYFTNVQLLQHFNRGICAAQIYNVYGKRTLGRLRTLASKEGSFIYHYI